MIESNENINEGSVAEIPVKRKSRVSPWRNREEFEMVYNWLYGCDANSETKFKACKRMLIWKVRRLDLTPASVLSTLVISEVQLKDDPSITLKQSLTDLRVMYSSAFTRFLNYMSSIMQTKNMKTMYKAAKELGLESFMVDLRHLCAHGQSMPSLEIFRKTADYCIKWLKEFYWDHEKEFMQNVDAKHIRQKDRTLFDESVSELFLVYDAATEALFKGCTSIVEAKKNLATATYNILKKYSNQQEIKALDDIASLVVKDLSALVKRESGLKDVQQIYISALLKMSFFFQVAAHHISTEEQIKEVIKLHRTLFQAVAFFGFIEGLFYDLIAICENKYEVTYRRKGANFWANQVAVGFEILKSFKIKYKEKKEEDPDINFDLSTLNNTAMAKNVRSLYHEMGVDINSILIFGDTFRRPWSLCFARTYIDERVKNINEFTAEIVKNCLPLVIPPLKEEQIYHLRTLIDLYLNQPAVNLDDDEDCENKTMENFKLFTVQKDILKYDDTEEMDIDIHKEEQQFGIWSTIPDGQDWHTCPLGRLPWE